MASNGCDNLKPGDLIEIFRPVYQHWAIYVGKGYVIHLSPPNEGSEVGFGSLMSVLEDKAIVRKDSLWKVVGNDRHLVNNKMDAKRTPLDPWDIVSEAERWVGCQVSYSVTTANCEHFVTNLRYGRASSAQVDTVTDMAAGVGVVLLFGAIATACYQFLKPQNQHKK